MVAHNFYERKAAVAHSRHLPWLAPQTAPGARARATLVQGGSSWTRGERAYGVWGRVPGPTGGQNWPRGGRTSGLSGPQSPASATWNTASPAPCAGAPA